MKRMRALLINPKSPHSFWTFDATTRNLRKQSTVIPLGLVTVAALLPESWELKLVDHEFEEIAEELWSWADIALLTGMLAHKDDMLDILAQARKRQKLVAVGGPYASLLPEEMLQAGARYVVTGEGESSIPIWLEALGRGDEPGVFTEDEKLDLAHSPLPRFDLLDLDAYTMAAVQTSRGCPFGCEFCDIGTLYGRKPRHKTPEQTLDELKALHAIGWNGPLMISDDNFIGSKSHAKGILNRLLPWMRQEGQPFDFWTQTSVNLGQDPELIDLMTAANFGFVFLGIENPNEQVLRQANKAHNVSKPLLQSIRTINQRGLSIVGSFIIGFDGEQKGTGEQIRDFVEEADLPIVMINSLHALPGTPLWERLRKEGRLLDDHSGSILTGSPINFVPTRPVEEIAEELLRLTSHLYDPVNYIQRARRFYLNMRPTRKALNKKNPMPECELTSPPRKARKKRNMPSDVSLFTGLVWKHGIRAPYRIHFWKGLWEMIRSNPSRLNSYLNCIAIGENLFRLPAVVLKRLGSLVSDA